MASTADDTLDGAGPVPRQRFWDALADLCQGIEAGTDTSPEAIPRFRAHISLAGTALLLAGSLWICF